LCESFQQFYLTAESFFLLIRGKVTVHNASIFANLMDVTRYSTLLHF